MSALLPLGYYGFVVVHSDEPRSAIFTGSGTEFVVFDVTWFSASMIATIYHRNLPASDVFVTLSIW